MLRALQSARSYPMRAWPHLFAALVGACVLVAPAHGQPAVEGSLLGLGEADLQSQFSDMRRLAKPTPGPHGLRGTWVLPNTPLAGLPFETTFFVKNRRVERIEQRWATARQTCDAAASGILAQLAVRYGEGVHSDVSVSGGASQQSSVWAAGEFDVMAYFTQAASQCSVLVAYEMHPIKDASQL